MSGEIYDVVIVGGGPAGLTAAIYTGRRSLKTLVITQDIGGQLALTDSVENYPGFLSIGGLELSEKFKEQAEKSGAQIKFAQVTGLKKQNNEFIIQADAEEIKARTVILAFGLSPRTLDVPGEKELTGRGVTYCATCDGPLYRGKTVAVIGGGNSALDAGEYLSKLAQKVYMLHRRDEFRGEAVLIDHVKSAPNIEIIYNAQVTAVQGQKKVEGLSYKTTDGQEKEIKLDGIFVEIGHVAKSDWLKNIINLTDRREIKINQDCETNLPGVFSAGDISEITYKQAVISAGEGCKAALQAYRYLQGNKPLMPDWTPKKL